MLNRALLALPLENSEGPPAKPGFCHGLLRGAERSGPSDVSTATHPKHRQKPGLAGVVSAHLQAVALAGLCLVSAACNSTSASSGSAVESYIAIDPGTFGVPCSGQSDAGDGFASYVVSLVELTEEVKKGDVVTVEVERATSPPQRCGATLLFSASDNGLTSWWPYVADIWGYATTDLEPDDDDPTLMRQDGEIAQPTWVGSCGRLGDEAVPGDAGAPIDEDFYRNYNGPQYLVSRRTITLRGCVLSPAEE